MHPLDTIRLEVLTDGHQELYASPGDRSFSARHPMSFAGSGMLSDGVFGQYMREILTSGYISNAYQGEEEIAGRRLARYDYRLPLLWSGQAIRTLEGSGKVGLHGSYWVDPRTYDVVRMELNADSIPPALPIAEWVTNIQYARTVVSHTLTVLLPESAEVRSERFNGEISVNRMEFTHCRTFSAETNVVFDAAAAADQPARFGVSSVDDTLRPLPAGLQIAVKLRTRITDDMAVGQLIDGVVAGDVMAKRKPVIAAGSPVRGRIRRLERYTDPFPYFVVALEFTEVQAEGIRYRFYADPVDIQPIAGVEQKLWTEDRSETAKFFDGGSLTRQRRENLFLYDLPGVVSFFFKATKLELPQDFRTVWKTRLVTP